MTWLPRLALLLPLLGTAAAAEVLPADSGIIDVRQYGAQGNGKDDDTEAILKAIAASGEDTGPAFWQDRMVYLPNGTYLVSAPLLKRYADGRFGSGLMLIGESQSGTVIRLKDQAPGYGDPGRLQAVVFTSSKLLDSENGRNYRELGEGNDAYMNFLENLTIEVGAGNPGAVAVDFLGNNLAAIRNVTLRAAAGSGAIGLSMTRKWPGPTLVQNLEVIGFGTGIATAQTEYGLTFEHIRLRDQSLTPLRNDQNSVTFRDLEIAGGPLAAIVNSGDKAFLAIEDGHIEAAGDLQTAISNRGFAVLRRLQVGGRSVSGVLRGENFAESKPPDWLPPMLDPPKRPKADKWINAAAFGATGQPGDDATDALKRALASGAAVIYLPHGTYAIDAGLEIPASLQRIVGMNSTLKVTPQRSANFARSSGMLRVGGEGPPLFLEHLAFDNSNQGDQLGVEISGGRDLVIRDVVSAGVTLLDRKAGGGKVFLEDVCCGRIMLAGTQPVFARQLDTEGGGIRIANNGAPLAVRGIKTEGVCIVLDNRGGGHADIFGGLLYVVRDGAAPMIPAFQNTDSFLSASLVEESLREASRYQRYLVTAPAADFPARGFGRFIPNLVDTP